MILTAYSLTPEQNVIQADYQCLGWQETDQCKGGGNRLPQNDKDCSATIASTESGQCLCIDNSNPHQGPFTVSFDCGHAEMTCSDVCQQTGMCSVPLEDRQDCIGPAGGDPATCKASTDPPCCFDKDGAAQGISPWCYKGVLNRRVINGALVAVNGVNILSSTDAYGNCGGGYNGSHMWNGILLRYIGYAVDDLQTFFRSNPSQLTDSWKNTIAKVKAFVSNNLNWVVPNGLDKRTGRYGMCWQLNSDQQQVNVVDNNFSSLDTFSVVDLINTATLLGLNQA
jgi:hypothetical protein